MADSRILFFLTDPAPGGAYESLVLGFLAGAGASEDVRILATPEQAARLAQGTGEGTQAAPEGGSTRPEPRIEALTAGEAGDRRTLPRRLRRLAEGAGYLAVVVENDLQQREAAMLKLQRRHPTFVVRIRPDAAPVRKTFLSKLVNNRHCAINLFLKRADYEAYYAAGDGRLALDNPCVLEQDGQSPATVFAFCLQALLRPTVHPTNDRPKETLQHIDLTYVTHFYFNQRNSETLRQLLEHYAGYARELRERIHFVLVDDGSPLEYTLPDVPLNLTWLKVRPDIPWNQAGARNLGLVYAKSDKVILTDIDHLFPEATLAAAADARPCGKRFYKFHRRPEGGGGLMKAHPNIFLLSRARYFELHGCDEEFGGAYGAEDFRFVKIQKLAGSIQLHFPKKHPIVDRKLDRGDSYHTLRRDLTFNTPIDSRKRGEIDCYGHAYGHSRLFLNFQWDILRENRLPVTTPPRMDRRWKLRWWLRALKPRY